MKFRTALSIINDLRQVILTEDDPVSPQLENMELDQFMAARQIVHLKNLQLAKHQQHWLPSDAQVASIYLLINARADDHRPARTLQGKALYVCNYQDREMMAA